MKHIANGQSKSFKLFTEIDFLQNKKFMVK